VWNHIDRGVKTHGNLCNSLYIIADLALVRSEVLGPAPDEMQSTHFAVQIEGLAGERSQGRSTGRHAETLKTSRREPMKHKFQLNGAVALALITICMALFALAPAVISSAMKTR
jgi:hypothetical protein